MDEAERLATLRDQDLLDTPPEPAFDAIVAEAARTVGTPIALISLVDQNRQWFKAKLGLDGEETPIDQSICAHAIASGERSFIVNDARRDARFAQLDDVAGGIGIRFYAGAPLTMANGAKLGTLCVVDVEPRAELDADERLALEALARRTVAAFELRRSMRDREAAIAALDADAARDVWLEQAARLLGQAAAALGHAEAAAPLAHLEHVIASVEAMRMDVVATDTGVSIAA